METKDIARDLLQTLLLILSESKLIKLYSSLKPIFLTISGGSQLIRSIPLSVRSKICALSLRKWNLMWPVLCVHRGLFKTLSNIYDGVFFCWNSQQRLVVNYFLKKALVLDVWQGPKYTSDAYVVVYVIVALSR